MQSEEMNDLNENKMSLDNMPVIMVPKPLPLVRKMCYLPEHYPPYVHHSEEPNCPCSFCVRDRYAKTINELNIATKEIPQIETLITTEILDDDILDEEILLEPVARSLQFPIPLLIRSTNDPSTWDADDEDILLV